MSSTNTPSEMKRLPENMAARMTVQSTTEDARRRRKTCVLEGDGVALGGSGMGAKISKPDAESQRRFPLQSETEFRQAGQKNLPVGSRSAQWRQIGRASCRERV